MQIGRVSRRLVATEKHPVYEGKKILMVELLDAQKRRTGDTLLAIDQVGAGVGDLVLTCSEGRWARECFGQSAPVRSTIISVLAGVDVDAT